MVKVYFDNKTDREKLKNDIGDSRTAIALGQFDAIHKGHMEIISRVVNHAKENNMKSLVYMLENNPQEVISGKVIPLVNTVEKRLEILESLGVDMVVLEKFDRDYMSIPYTEFVCEYLYKKLNAGFVSVGYNYRFGKGGLGNTDLLTRECKRCGIGTAVVPKVEVDGEAVSSTAIREKVSGGDLSGTEKMLGRSFSVKGEVVRGNQIGGRYLGFPTANIELPTEIIQPKLGVYASRTRVGGRTYKSITNIGAKPTVGDTGVSIETHIDGNFGELYGQIIEVELCRYIRDIKKFENLDALAEQLKKDKEKM